MCEISQLKRQNELARNSCVFVDTYPIYLLKFIFLWFEFSIWALIQRLDHLLLMTSYLLIIVTDHHQTRLKMLARDKRTATENFRSWCFTV